MRRTQDLKHALRSLIEATTTRDAKGNTMGRCVPSAKAYTDAVRVAYGHGGPVKPYKEKEHA